MINKNRPAWTGEERRAVPERGSQAMTRRQRLQPVTSINLIPLIDVLLLIIIFFMVTTTFKLAPGHLPRAALVEHGAEREELGAPGGRGLGERDLRRQDPHRLAGLPALIGKRAGSGDAAGSRPRWRATAAPSYQLMVSVLDALRRGGIDSVGLRTRVDRAAP